MYDLYVRNPGIPHHTARKLMRWALKLSAFPYVVEHIAVERNVWADMLTRLAVKPNNKIISIKAFKSLMFAPINPGMDPNLDWPSRDDIIESQKSAYERSPNTFKIMGSIWVDHNERLWIPNDGYLLKLRILIAAHTGQSGHRGNKVTLTAVKAHFSWINMKNDVEQFVE